MRDPGPDGRWTGANGEFRGSGLVEVGSWRADEASDMCVSGAASRLVILACIEGATQIDTAGLVLRGGHVALVRPDRDVRLRALGRCTFQWVILDEDSGSTAADVLRGSGGGVVRRGEPVMSSLADLVTHVKLSGESCEPADRLEHSALGVARLTEVAVYLARALRVLATRACTDDQAVSHHVPDHVADALEQVRRRPHEAWTVERMSRTAKLGVSAFSRWCRRTTGRSPRWFLLECRLAAAAERLTHTNQTVTSIAFETGFSSSQHFATAFRRMYGESPGAYREAPDRSVRPAERATTTVYG
jgi:AraC-like DNA-binding protein